MGAKSPLRYANRRRHAAFRSSFAKARKRKWRKPAPLLPDAAFCKFSRLKSALRSATQVSAASAPVVPVAMMDRYAGRTTAQKLGIREGDAVCVIRRARDMPAALGELPADVTFVETGGCGDTLFRDRRHTSCGGRLSSLRRSPRKPSYGSVGRKGSRRKVASRSVWCGKPALLWVWLITRSARSTKSGAACCSRRNVPSCRLSF